MPAHDDSRPYREQRVAPPADLAWHRDPGGFPVFTGTCPVCHAPSTSPFPAVVPGTVGKGWPWQQSTAPEDPVMECLCRGTHPQNAEELPGCGAWWPVRLPPGVAP